MSYTSHVRKDSDGTRTLPQDVLHPDFHLFETGLGPHLFLVNASQVYGLGQPEYERLSATIGAEAIETADVVLSDYALISRRAIGDDPIVSPPLRALSLAVAQKCNLACTYCYAQQGAFGAPAKQMPLSIALSSVDRLFEEVEEGELVNLAFLGGEPMIAREVIQKATERAARLAQERRVKIGFSLTTNGTLLTAEDAEFFEAHGFAVSISLDGIGDVHDRQRPFKGGRGSFARILARVAPLLDRQRRMQVSARVTVTPQNLDLPRTLKELLQRGFHSVGFSPMLSSPNGSDEMDQDALVVMLDQMIACGREFEHRTIAGERYAFSNMNTAMKEIHRGTYRPYPCGAGAGYMGVSAEGDLSACHRFVNDEIGAMGNILSGIDRSRQENWLASRHVHRQEPCRSCWARYLCGGGCHHEVVHRGRPACDYIRGWLHYCLQAYVRVLSAKPEYFRSASN